jgi:lantibiotic modifying enzyme
MGAGLRSRDINTGGAGTLLALAELVAELGDPCHQEALAAGARWLVRSPSPGGHLAPGLYIGEAGVGAALLRAGQALGDETLIGEAARRGRWIATLPYESPDLFNGTAGRLRFHLFLWDETGDREHLRDALAAGEALLAAAEDTGDGLRWSIPPGYDLLSGNAYLGYAHGAAGIGDALLDLCDATGDERFLRAAQGAGRWLARLAFPALEHGDGLNWPITEGGDLFGPFWCHGAAGIGRFFMNAATHGALLHAADLAARAARTVGHGARWAGTTQCHGLAGTIEFLLDMAQATGQRSYLHDAHTLARLMQAFASERDGLLVFPSEGVHVFSPDYLVGYAGVATCLLRLGDPERLPHLMSRRGFGSRRLMV